MQAQERVAARETAAVEHAASLPAVQACLHTLALHGYPADSLPEIVANVTRGSHVLHQIGRDAEERGERAGPCGEARDNV